MKTRGYARELVNSMNMGADVEIMKAEIERVGHVVKFDTARNIWVLESDVIEIGGLLTQMKDGEENMFSKGRKVSYGTTTIFKDYLGNTYKVEATKFPALFFRFKGEGRPCVLTKAFEPFTEEYLFKCAKLLAEAVRDLQYYGETFVKNEDVINIMKRMYRDSDVTFDECDDDEFFDDHRGEVYFSNQKMIEAVDNDPFPYIWNLLEEAGADPDVRIGVDHLGMYFEDCCNQVEYRLPDDFYMNGYKPIGRYEYNVFKPTDRWVVEYKEVEGKDWYSTPFIDTFKECIEVIQNMDKWAVEEAEKEVEEEVIIEIDDEDMLEEEDTDELIIFDAYIVESEWVKKYTEEVGQIYDMCLKAPTLGLEVKGVEKSITELYSQVTDILTANKIDYDECVDVYLHIFLKVYDILPKDIQNEVNKYCRATCIGLNI